MKILKEILEEINQAKIDSIEEGIRTGDYRIGLTKAEQIINSKINEEDEAVWMPRKNYLFHKKFNQLKDLECGGYNIDEALEDLMSEGETKDENSKQIIRTEVDIYENSYINWDNNLTREGIMDEFMKRRLKCEEDCVKEVLRQYIGKEPTREDTKKVSRGFYVNDKSRYILSYDGVQLGMITYTEDGSRFKVNFTPDETDF